MDTKKRIIILLSFALLLISLFSHLNYIGLRAEEPRRAIVGMEASITGNMIVPQIHNQPYYNKPPVFNWVLVAFFEMFSSFEEWIVRLPGILSLLAISILNFFLARKYINREAALLSTLLFLISGDILFYASVNAGEIDLFYTLLVFLQITSIFVFSQKGKYLHMFLFSYFFAAIGLLTKGLPSVAFQGITIILILFMNRKFKLFFNWRHFSGIALFLCITSFYFYIYSQNEDVSGFLVNLFKESSQRSPNEAQGLTILNQLIRFPFQFLQIMLPGSALIIFLFRNNFMKILKMNSLVKFSAVFLICNILLYWFSPGVKNRYLYMFFPFAYMILAFFYTRKDEWNKRINPWLDRIFGGTIILFIILFVLYPFFDEVNSAAGYPVLIAVAFTLVFSAIFYLYLRWRELRIYLFIFAVIFLRFGFNYAFLPQIKADSRTQKYMKDINNILEITRDEKIWFTGEPYIFEPDISLFNHEIKKVRLKTPPTLSYQIPYYITKSNGYILEYDEIPKKGRYYLAFRDFINEHSVSEYYVFNDLQKKKEIILFKLR